MRPPIRRGATKREELFLANQAVIVVLLKQVCVREINSAQAVQRHREHKPTSEILEISRMAIVLRAEKGAQNARLRYDRRQFDIAFWASEVT